MVPQQTTEDSGRARGSSREREAFRWKPARDLALQSFDLVARSASDGSIAGSASRFPRVAPHAARARVRAVMSRARLPL